ncbi:MAG: hypothetical protein AAF297_04455 [Planctomycetota bacterium]
MNPARPAEAGGERGGAPSTDREYRARVRASDLSPQVRFTLLALADGFDRQTGAIAMSIDRICKMLGVKDRRSAQRRLRKAEEVGALITLDPGGGSGRVRRYRLGPALVPDGKGGTDAAVNGGTDATVKGGICAPEGRHPRPERAAPTPPVQENQESPNITKGAGGGGSGEAPPSWQGTPAEFEEALRVATELGHNAPRDFAERAGTLARVVWFADTSSGAKNPAGAAEAKLRRGDTPPPEWLRRFQANREHRRRLELEARPARTDDRTAETIAERIGALEKLDAEALAAVVERRAGELSAADARERAARLRRVHKAGRLFEPDPDAATFAACVDLARLELRGFPAYAKWAGLPTQIPQPLRCTG